MGAAKKMKKKTMMKSISYEKETEIPIQKGASPFKNTRIIKKEIDPYRDTPIRFIGYCSEVGESLRYIFPRFVMPGYMIALGYSFADTIDKAKKQYL